METLITSGRIADLILGLVVLEATVLIGYWYRSRRGIVPAELIFNLASGASLLLALRAALTQSGWRTVATFLAAAGLAHACDLYRRWR